mgnify:CR=1 FL=1
MNVLGSRFVASGLSFSLLGIGLLVSGEDVGIPAGLLWYEMDSASLNSVQSFMQRYIHAGLWDSVIVPLLNRPAWEALAFLVLFFAIVGGLVSSLRNKRRRRYFGK